MRATATFSRLLRLPGIWVRNVAFQADKAVVTVALRRRHLDLGAWRLKIRAELRRLDCPTHGVRREQVPFARAASQFSRDFEDLVGWLATTMDKTAICRLVRID